MMSVGFAKSNTKKNNNKIAQMLDRNSRKCCFAIPELVMVAGLSGVQFGLLLYIVHTISILLGKEPPAYFGNSCDFAHKHDNSIICYPVIPADYTARSAHA